MTEQQWQAHAAALAGWVKHPGFPGRQGGEEGRLTVTREVLRELLKRAGAL